MDSKDRARIIEKLALLWDQVPSQRFGQMLFNYTPVGNRVAPGAVRDPFHYLDSEFEEYLDYHLGEFDNGD